MDGSGYSEALWRICKAQVAEVTELNLSNLELQVLPDELFELHELKRLYISNNELQDLPEGLGRLANLTELYVYCNKLQRLPDSIGRLCKLQVLHVARNKLQVLPDSLGKLNNLRELDVVENQLHRLPETLVNLHKLKRMRYSGNCLPGLDEAISLLPLDAIHYILRLQSDEAQAPINEAKVVLVGDSAVGKTSLRKVLLGEEFDKNEPTTHGISICTKNHEQGNDCLRLNIWDFGGQEIQHATHQFFFTHRTLYVLVLIARTEDRYDDANYWLKLIQQRAGDSPVLVVINKIDLDDHDIDRATLQRNYPNIVGFVRTSCVQSSTIHGLYCELIKKVKMLKHIDSTLPAIWMSIKSELTDMPDNFIEIQQYQKIFQKYASDETKLDQDILLRLLHDIGSVIHFHDTPRLSGLGVLKPQWVTSGVYKVVTDPIIMQRCGVFGLADLVRILDIEIYPPQARCYLLDIMSKFELCYRLAGHEDDYLIPRLLSEDTPPKVTGDFTWDQESLRLVLELDVVPSSLIARFIVRNCDIIIDSLQWRGGVVISNGNNTACVRREIRKSCITIEVKGNKTARRDFLSFIREDFGNILGKHGRECCKELVPVQRRDVTGGDQSRDAEVLIPLQHFKVLEAEGISSHLFPEVGGNVDVSKVLYGYRTREKGRSNMSQRLGDINIHVEGAKVEASPQIRIEQQNTQSSNVSINISAFREMIPAVAGDLRSLCFPLRSVGSDEARALAAEAEELASELEKHENAQTPGAVERSGVLQGMAWFLKKCSTASQAAGKIIMTTGLTEIIKALVAHGDKLSAAMGLPWPY